MDFLRKHWYDIGGVLIIITISLLYLYHSELTNYQLLMWLSLVSLFLHQLEEYRLVGTFPRMVNKIMYGSNLPDRYPLNTNTALIVNVFVGWSIYFLAALTKEKAVWLGISTILVSLGNIIAHTLIFNIKGKTIYNAGLATSWLFLAPCVYFFFQIVFKENLAATIDFIIGIPLGLAFNVFGILKPIQWFADKNTKYIFKNS